jgi:hypothetical protein
MNSSVPGLLRRLKWFETDVSVLPIGPIFKDQPIQEEYGRDLENRNFDFKSP